MTLAEPSTLKATGKQQSDSAFYRLVWKWHFLAGLYVLPFMMLLAITGAIYLYKPQIEKILYADRFFVSVAAEKLPVETQLKAIRESVGITKIRGVTVFEDPSRSTMVEFDDSVKVRSYAWVNPYTGAMLGSIARDEMAMSIVKKAHGELSLGDVGTKFVELAAHWAIVMFVTGVYLWWPRGQRTFAKAVSLPSGAGRSWWRKTHMFTGFLASLLVVPILITGLPWTDVWGSGLSYVQAQTDQQSRSLRFGGNVPNSMTSEGQTIPMGEVYRIAKTQGLKMPYELRPPKNNEAAYWIRSASKNRKEQTELIVDQYSGDVLARVDFEDNPVVAKAVSYGISFHQGELYGWTNIFQNTVASILTLVLSITGVVAWWKRRPIGELGVPSAPSASLTLGWAVLVVGLAIVLPLVGASLILVLFLDWILFKRLGWFGGKPA